MKSDEEDKTMEFILLLLKGFVIGIAFIIPGVSGGTVAFYLGIYDRIIHAIGHLFSEFKKSMSILIPVALGIMISVVMLAKLMAWLLNVNSFMTMLFFIGLLLGGIPGLIGQMDDKPFKKTRTLIPMIVGFVLVMVLLVAERKASGDAVASIDISFANFWLLFLLGAISAITMIVPGISGSALLMVLGYYTAIVTGVFKNLFDYASFGYNIYVILSYGFGAVVGVLLFSRPLDYLLTNHRRETLAAIIGFVAASVIMIFLEIRDPATNAEFVEQTPVYLDFWNFARANIGSIVGGILLGVGGFLAAYFMIRPKKADPEDVG